MGSIINLGGDRAITIEALARLVRDATGSQSPIVHVPYGDAYPRGFEEIDKRRPDLSVARAILGFEATRSVEEIVRDIVADDATRMRRAVRDAVATAA
jgi:UDP-glucose 4-epimerase